MCTTGDVCTAGICGGTVEECSSSTDTCDPSSGCATTCGAGGCQVASSGGDGTLTIPAGALAANVRISMVFEGADPNDPSVFQVYELGPDGTTFATPATVNLPAPALAPGETAVIEVFDGTQWVEIPTTLADGRLTGPISHFSGCRSRVKAPVSAPGVIVLDMVEFQEVFSPSCPGCRPGGLQIAGCDPGGASFGICLTIMNPAGQPALPGPTLRATIAGWQCNSQTMNFTDASGNFEGEHCNQLVFACDPVAVDLPLPSGLASGASTTIRFDLGGSDVFSCIFGWLGGIDVLFREPGPGDQRAGMRSAIVGPAVCDPSGCGPFQGVFPVDDPATKTDGNGKRIKNFLIDARE